MHAIIMSAILMQKQRTTIDAYEFVLSVLNERHGRSAHPSREEKLRRIMSECGGDGIKNLSPTRKEPAHKT